MERIKKYALFEVFGVELEYMIVDRYSLKVKPISDKLLHAFSNNYSGDFENGTTDWSNELVGHVIELKNHRPQADFKGMEKDFSKNIKEINGFLEQWNSILLPTAMHPFFNPLKETSLWLHENQEIYKLYNKLFNCNNHGWANLQSVHLNLPFANEKEFAVLHAAVRLLLPFIPAIAASSPIVEGKFTPYADNRLWYYLNNQNRIPSLIGQLIPEPVYTRRAYFNTISRPIIHDFKKLDPEGIMSYHFLNSRGAIARFDRQAIEIRVMDIQESPQADFILIRLIVLFLKYILSLEQEKINQIKRIKTQLLRSLFMEAIKNGGEAKVDNRALLALFDEQLQTVSMKEFWLLLLDRMEGDGSSDKATFQRFLEMGSLSHRIRHNIKGGKSIRSVYTELGHCLLENRLYSS